MINGEKIIAILKPRKDQIRIYGNWIEIEIQKSGINFSCGLDWWNAEYKEPTTKNDLGVNAVSRQAVIDTIFEECSGTKLDIDFAKVLMLQRAIKALPPATPQESRWIPIIEKLPNIDDFTGSKVWQKKVLITGYLSFDDTKDLFVSEAFAKDVICNSVHDTVVIAWMPLPLSWEGE